MEKLMSVWQFFHSDVGVAILVALAAVSEALALIPAIKANSVLQLVAGVLRRFKKEEQV